ncbi:Uncharacterised protein [Serratia plymuthica]|nr:Uncharacterised protein [Serratia plymuthica]
MVTNKPNSWTDKQHNSSHLKFNTNETIIFSNVSAFFFVFTPHQPRRNANENIRLLLFLRNPYCVIQYAFLEPPSLAYSHPSEA